MSTEIDLQQIEQFDLNLDQYFGLWSVEDAGFMQLFKQVANADLVAHVSKSQVVPQSATNIKTDQSNTIGLIDINGTMTKRGSSFSSAGAMVVLKKQIRQFASDPDIGGIVIRIDSPGGTVSGTADLANEVEAARKKKPVYAFCEDLTASAAYWVASQCTKVFANNKTAMIGSVGTYVGLYDYSGAAEKEGIKAIVIKSSDLKGAGFPGSEITEEQISIWQDLINKTQSQFTEGVSAGRGISIAEAEKLATGRVYMAEDALSLGMIDKIASFDEMLTDLRTEVAGKSKSKRRSTVTNTDKVAATVAEIKKACPKADSNFIVDAVEKGLSIEETKDLYIENLQEQVSMRDEELEEEKTKSAESKKKKPGVDADLGPGDRTSTQADYGDDFSSQVRQLCKDGNKTRREAMKEVARRDPESHQDYLLSNNKKSAVQKLIKDRFVNV